GPPWCSRTGSPLGRTGGPSRTRAPSSRSELFPLPRVNSSRRGQGDALAVPGSTLPLMRPTMPRSFGLPALSLLVCLAGGWAARPAHASLAASSSVSLAAPRTVEGRVTRLDPRLDAHGYPVTDVTLDDGS